MISLLLCALIGLVAASKSYLIVGAAGNDEWIYVYGSKGSVGSGNNGFWLESNTKYSSRNAARSALDKLRNLAKDKKNFSIVGSGPYEVELKNVAITHDEFATEALCQKMIDAMVEYMNEGPEFWDANPSDFLGFFEVLKNHQGSGFTWRLRGANRLVIAHGEKTFATVNEAYNTVFAIKDAALVYENFKLLDHPGDSKGEWSFELRSSTGSSSKLWAISEKYRSSGARENGIYSVMHNVAAPIRDLTGLSEEDRKRDLLEAVIEVGEDIGEFFWQAFGLFGELLGWSHGYDDVTVCLGAAEDSGMMGEITDLTKNNKRSSRFEVFCSESNTQRYAFRLVASNGEIVLQSELYTTKQNAKKGVASVRANAEDESNFNKLIAKDDSPYFTLIAQNNQIIGVSETYSSDGARDHGIGAVIRAAKLAKDVDLAQECAKRHLPEGFEFPAANLEAREDSESSASVLAATSAIFVTIMATL